MAMQLRLEFQRNAVADEVAAITAVVRPILLALLHSLKREVVHEAGGYENVKLKMLSRLYRPGDGDCGLCFALLFPTTMVLQVNHLRDIEHLRQHVRTGGDAFVTLDGDFLDARRQRLQQIGIWCRSTGDPAGRTPNAPPAGPRGRGARLRAP